MGKKVEETIIHGPTKDQESEWKSEEEFSAAAVVRTKKEIHFHKNVKKRLENDCVWLG